VPIHVDQKLELKLKIKQPFTVVAVGDLLEFQPFSKLNDPDVQFLMNLTRNSDLTIGDLEDEIYDFDNFGHAGVDLGTKEVADDWANMGIKMVSRRPQNTSSEGTCVTKQVTKSAGVEVMSAQVTEKNGRPVRARTADLHRVKVAL
jgi:hypothetical protein